MKTIRIVDAYCGVGGATKGYQMAAEELGLKVRIIGVDIVDQPEYCGDDFVRMDALKFLRWHRRKFDAAHASPPCQDHSLLTLGNRARGLFDNHRNMVAPTRRMLQAAGKPWVMENVMGAPMRTDVMLCGLMFGLNLFRHRKFELEGFDIPQVPEHPSHQGHRIQGYRHGVFYPGKIIGAYGAGGGKGELPRWQEALGIDWTRNWHSLSESIPPHFTRPFGISLLKKLAGLDSQMY